ncbi:MAG TPA: hypothetical protein DCE56_02245 [Cyanobacteria bacterium UBA8553]|nr:hypothetical protein [Cyanobacteria bacterium UBA8553]HAJ64294.1 hypothetical protein [Cyanobacteria bacterium UBA8543]
MLRKSLYIFIANPSNSLSGTTWRELIRFTLKSAHLRADERKQMDDILAPCCEKINLDPIANASIAVKDFSTLGRCMSKSS